MRIIFICGCVELGVDGVGDYTRRLAAELIKQKHEVAILAIHDQFVITEVNHIENIENIELQIYRIPSVWSTTRRFKLAKKWINNFNPEWLSLQYVPFSFNIKGLPFGLNKSLSLFKDRKWHIMFHELWVGMEENTNFKLLIWGVIQKLLIKKMLTILKPSVVHTQTKLYQIQLAKLGVNSGYLPLFSNIPINTNDSVNTSFNNKDHITFVGFGTIHPNAPIKKFAEEAAAFKMKTGTDVSLILIGRCGKELETWKKIWETAGLKITVLGEQLPNRISEVFNNSSFGITTTALPLVEKSGSVAAMHQHNLPVICISKPWYPKGIKGIKLPPGVIAYIDGNFNSCVTNISNISYIDVHAVAQQLAESLTII
ncbi:MAG: hypothetical protein ACRYFA_12700 [Janthinobacterium lividum]